MRTEHGFTLVELTIALLVLGIASASLFSIFTTIQHVQTQTGYTASATRAAQREIETLRNDNYNSLTAGQNINFSSQLTNLPSGSTGTVVVSEPTPGLKRVDVTVVYKYSGVSRQVELSSFIGVIGITQ